MSEKKNFSVYVGIEYLGPNEAGDDSYRVSHKYFVGNKCIETTYPYSQSCDLFKAFGELTVAAQAHIVKDFNKFKDSK